MDKTMQELLTGTLGMARMARAYADNVQANKIDGDDYGISLSSDIRLHCHTARSDCCEVEIIEDGKGILFSSRQARALFGALYGIVSAEYDESLEPQPTREEIDLRVAIALLRAIRTEHPEVFQGEDHAKADVLLARYSNNNGEGKQ